MNMANIRMFALVLILLIVVNCTLVSSETSAQLLVREKRFLGLGCAKMGKKCSGFFGKSCCKGTVCNTTSGKCVRRGSSTSWLNDRNGK